MRFLPSHKTAAVTHQCGNPPTYHQIIYVEALKGWRCVGCGRIVG